ncbi:protein FAM241B-like [Tubulanus polymorphus]|uniref:protein FAM241B-like n=1 Tax=Tubulanus polymorphus TaxID=672921 RepID=UPI003DA20023
MVRILSSGEIVQDDDPRLRRSTGPEQRRANIQQIQHDDPQQQPEAAAGGGAASVFDTLNQKLLDVGIPRFNVRQYTVEPIVTTGFVLAGLIMGVRGLLFCGLLFAVSKLSQGRNGGQQGQRGGQLPSRGRPPTGGGGGGGQRLGRN